MEPCRIAELGFVVGIAIRYNHSIYDDLLIGVVIGCMYELMLGRERRALLILDNLRVHHSKTVKKWL